MDYGKEWRRERSESIPVIHQPLTQYGYFNEPDRIQHLKMESMTDIGYDNNVLEYRPLQLNSYNVTQPNKYSSMMLSSWNQDTEPQRNVHLIPNALEPVFYSYPVTGDYTDFDSWNGIPVGLPHPPSSSAYTKETFKTELNESAKSSDEFIELKSAISSIIDVTGLDSDVQSINVDDSGILSSREVLEKTTQNTTQDLDSSIIRHSQDCDTMLCTSRQQTGEIRAFLQEHVDVSVGPESDVSQQNNTGDVDEVQEVTTSPALLAESTEAARESDQFEIAEIPNLEFIITDDENAER
ncbi:uncharacterized protein LOC128635705 [Bombina bombina]|uniref:uncharacterized protein LOC128635705 n=1 Tax=Bombina bombina TaxID=8345 RepID=UPI00235A5787|nr:uncharacterized protein LOC128635705 [Bombina bombina]